MTPILEAIELSRWYGIVMGLNNVSFEIYPGITGLVGPNGAGKSTLIQIITGQLQPSSGSLTVFGNVPWNNPPLLRRIGLCPERESVHTDLDARSWLRALGQLSGMSKSEAASRADALLETVKLQRAYRTKRLASFSKGMRQRVKLAQALMHHPDLLILDEPMNGLDPMGRQEFATILKELALRGTNILISSHILAELEPLCKNILIMNWGRIIASGSQSSIREDLKNWSEELIIRCAEPERLARFLFDAGVVAGFDIDPAAGQLAVRVKDPADFYQNWTRLLLASGIRIDEIRSQTRSLKQIFEKVTA